VGARHILPAHLSRCQCTRGSWAQLQASSRCCQQQCSTSCWVAEGAAAGAGWAGVGWVAAGWEEAALVGAA
jgi:hypothetical protein